MKKSLSLIPIILITATLSGCKLGINHYEDKLYSEKVFNEYSENTVAQNNNIFTREKAIEKAITVFKNGLGVEIDRNKLSESIGLFKKSKGDTFKWQISWYDRENKISYDCQIDSSNGDIVNISYHEEQEKSEYKLVFSYSEVVEILSPLLMELNIDINNYELSESSKVPKLYSGARYVTLFFNSINNRDSGFSVIIDYQNKKVTYFGTSKYSIGLDGGAYEENFSG